MVHIAKQSQATSPDSVLSCLATTYLPSPSRDKYSRRWRSSRPCSGWVRVFPLRYGHQTSPLRLFLKRFVCSSLTRLRPSACRCVRSDPTSLQVVFRVTVVRCSFVLALTWLWLSPAGVLAQTKLRFRWCFV